MREISIDEIKPIQLDILNKFADYCEKSNLRYTLAYGTLIGSIRHKGYIPWDDDIDIAMPRPDYDRFIKNFNGKYENLLVYATEINPKFRYSFAKISNEKTKLIENSNLISNIGINIDVFPIDGILKEDLKRLKRQVFYKKMLLLKIIRVNKNRSFIKNIILTLGKILLFWLPIKVINNKMIKNSKKYSFEEQDFCCNISFGGIENKILPKDYFLEYIEHRFENRSFKVIKCYHEWLKSIYGDYMKFPPIEEQVTHHDYKAYIIQS